MSAIFGFTGAFDEQLFSSMRNSLAHRGKYSSHVTNEFATIGLWSNSKDPSDDDTGVGVTSYETNPWDRGTNGETLCGLAGFQTKGNSGDTIPLSSIASTILDCGEPPVELSGDLVGAFNRGNRLTLLRDGSGGRTIYYAQLNGRLFFSSEPKAIWALPGFSRQLNQDSLLKYLTFSFVPESPTMLENLYEVPAGCALFWSGGECQLKRFFRFENNDIPDLSDPGHLEDFHQTFRRSVADRMSLLDSDPVVFLSGGLDSSVVAAEIRDQHTANIQTFSLHFGEQYPNELIFAKQVATKLGTDHQEVLMEPRAFLGDLRKMIWHLDDPIGDPITMPNYSLAQKVSSNTGFVFNGEGGDPCLGGPKNLPMMLTHWYGGTRPDNFRELAYLESFRRGYEEIDYILADQSRVKDRRHCLVDVVKPYFDDKRPERLLDKLQLMNVRLKGAHLILPKVERMLGAHQVSPLSPLFSNEIVQQSFKLPPHLKLKNGIEKVVLKEIYRSRLPQEVIDRPKSGMRVPVHFWFQGELRKYAKHILSRRELVKAGIFNPQRVKQLLDYNIEEGNGRYGIRLWMLITFEIWRRLVIEGEPF